MNPNNLINEKSPYLLQHAYNPVNWNPWNKESINKAKTENKPIFLSIGYSTCYWCHVMERECFENPTIADMLNDTFVNIKVDREEMPDIDRIYMTALQSMTGSGGWPMSMFLTPDLKPFYGATYIPPKSKYGRAGFEDIISQIKNLWETKRDEIILSSEKIFSLLSNKIEIKGKTINKLDHTYAEQLFITAKSIYDYENGGFGEGNKFPRPVLLDFLLKYYYRTKEISALDMVTFTLKKMYDGGIWDNIDNGFHRYSVDKYWRVPHFEKMLYDQAQLINIYLDTYLITKFQDFLEVALKTANYCINFLLDKETGGFFSAEDAESAINPEDPDKKEEGYFYLWEKNELIKILDEEELKIFSHYFGILHNGNTINDPHSVFKSRNVLYKASDIEETARVFNKTNEEVRKIIQNSITKLKRIRDKRQRPMLDKKIITSWNAMMISALANLYIVTGEKKYFLTAKKTTEFIINTLYSGKSLYHRYIDRDVKYEGSLEDYSLLIKALIDMNNAGKNLQYSHEIQTLINQTIELFYDKENGGFYDINPSNSEAILKTKDLYDGAEPSGNSIMIENLIKASIIFKNNEYLDISEKCMKYFFETAKTSVFSYPLFFSNLLLITKLPPEIIISGHDVQIISGFSEIIDKKYIPGKICYIYNQENKDDFNSKIVKDFNIPAVYICENYNCKMPIKENEQLISELNKI